MLFFLVLKKSIFFCPGGNSLISDQLILKKSWISDKHSIFYRSILKTNFPVKLPFYFPIVYFPSICSNIPTSLACGVYISQFIRYSRACGYMLVWRLLLTMMVLSQDFLVVKLISLLQKFYKVTIMTWLIVAEYQCHRWPWTCSDCNDINAILLSYVNTYHGLIQLEYVYMRYKLFIVFKTCFIPVISKSAFCHYTIWTDENAAIFNEISKGYLCIWTFVIANMGFPHTLWSFGVGRILPKEYKLSQQMVRETSCFALKVLKQWFTNQSYKISSF